MTKIVAIGGGETESPGKPVETTEIAAKQLGVEPQACLYIGDGSSQELNGANGVG